MERHVLHGKRRLVASALLAVTLGIAMAVPVFAGWASVAGQVDEASDTANYNIQHCVSSYSGGPQVAVTGWPESNHPIYLAVRFNGITEPWVKIPLWDWNITNVAYLTQGSCYYFSAHTDWDFDFWDNVSWAANYRY
jgi:hypothetical protein